MSRFPGQPFSRLVMLATMVLLITACASISDLPDTANKVNYQAQATPRQLSSHNYQACTIYRDVDNRKVYKAAQYGLTVNNFDIKDASLVSRTLRGEHGISGVYWNIVAGVYFRKQSQGVAVKVIADTSRNFTLFKHDNGKDWAKAILKDMTHNLHTVLEKPVSSGSCRI